MDPKLYKVSDSIDLYAYRSDKFKSEILSVKLVVPCDRELSPINTLMLSVLRRGSEKYGSLAKINKRLDDLYAACLSINNSRIGDNQAIGYTAEIIGNRFIPDKLDVLDGVIDIMSQVLLYPALDENGYFQHKYVDSEKINLCNNIRSRINDTSSYAIARCREIMFADCPYGASLTGTEKQVSDITAQTLTQRWREVISNSRFRCFYLGEENPETVVAKLRHYFANKPTAENEIPILRKYGYENTDKHKELRVDEKMPVTQGKLVLGFRFPSSASGYAERVLNELYGASPVSKLFTNVREKLGLCYSCTSFYISTKNVMYVIAGINASDRELAEREMLEQLECIKRGEFTESEFCAIKKSIDSGIISGACDSLGYIEDFYFYRKVLGIDENVETFRRRIAEVTAHDVSEAAKSATLDTVYFLEGTASEEEDGE